MMFPKDRLGEFLRMLVNAAIGMLALYFAAERGLNIWLAVNSVLILWMTWTWYCHIFDIASDAVAQPSFWARLPRRVWCYEALTVVVCGCSLGVFAHVNIHGPVGIGMMAMGMNVLIVGLVVCQCFASRRCVRLATARQL